MGKEQELFGYSFVIFLFVSSHLVQSQYQPRIVGTTEYDLQLYLNRSIPTTLAPTTIAVPTTAPTVPYTTSDGTAPTKEATKATAPSVPTVPNTATAGTATETTTTVESDISTTVAPSTSSNNVETTATVSTAEQPTTTTEDVTTVNETVPNTGRRRLLSLDAGLFVTEKENLTIQLDKSFKDVTGYDKVNIETIDDTGREGNFQITVVNYTVSFDAQEVSKCLGSISCDFAGQMKDALDKTAKISLGGETVVDVARTQRASTEFINQENSTAGRLVNQCTAFLPCLIHGPQVTCNYNKNVTCKNVCEPSEKGYCRGGICQANDTVLNGVKMCSCPGHTFHNNWECLSWWILLGPIIGAGALLILFLILMCVLCVRLRKRKEDEHLRKLYSGKDSLDRYHSEGNDNTGYMPEPVSLARYDNIELANGQANKEPQTFTTPADKPSENTRSSLRREEPPPVETKQEMRELRREPIPSEYRPLVEEKAPLAYHHQDDTPEPRRSMYDKNWEQELAKQYDSRDFNLQNVPQDKFQFNRPKVVRPGQASFGESAPVARF